MRPERNSGKPSSVDGIAGKDERLITRVHFQVFKRIVGDHGLIVDRWPNVRFSAFRLISNFALMV